MDMILNGQAHGSVASRLLANNFDVSDLRPWVGKDGHSYIARNENGKPKAVRLATNNATLRRDEWIEIDRVVLESLQQRLKIVGDLRGRGLVYNIPNGMGKTVLTSQAMSDVTGASISMDPAQLLEGDRPQFDMTNLPLPVVHADFQFNAREIATSRNYGTPIDTTMVGLKTRRVAEEIEKLTLGVLPTYTYGGGTIYGFTNYPNRITASLTLPTASGWLPSTLISEILGMRQQSITNRYYGPWTLYASTGWSQYIDEDYSDKKGDNTLRQRILAIDGITGLQQADFLPGLQMLLVQATSDVIRMVIGMDVTTVQWETIGGLVQHFKVMAIMVPQLRSTYGTTATGVVHGNAA